MSWKDCVVEPIDRVELEVNGLRGYVERDLRYVQRDIRHSGEVWKWAIRMPYEDRFLMLESGLMVHRELPLTTKEAALESLYKVLRRFELNEVTAVNDETSLSDLKRIARG